MDFQYDETTKLTNLTIYKEQDICAKCPIEVRENCPLLLGIINNVVYPSAQSIEIEACSLYDSIPKDYKEF